MNIYHYDEKTKEFLNAAKAEANPEETRIQGKFVPLVPANSTLIAPPEYNIENQIPVFENREWVIKSDYRKNFYKVNNDLMVEDIKTIGEQEGYIIVDKVTGDAVKENPDKFKISDNKIIEKNAKEYITEQELKREAWFKAEFFEIPSFGWFRKTPKGYSSAVESINSAANAILLGSAVVPEGTFIFYKSPDFTDESQCNEEWLIKNQYKNEEMGTAAFKTFYMIFIEAWNNTEHK